MLVQSWSEHHGLDQLKAWLQANSGHPHHDALTNALARQTAPPVDAASGN